jgi:RHS repeat-associated protein
VTDGAGTLLWQWPYASNPFGETPPSSTSGYALNLRFPGQYYDVESGLNYNLNRDYEPATGRYLQSDPLGIAAGASTYIYGDGNSLANSDLFGLCDPDRCEELRKQITKVRNELAKRYGDLLTDKLGLPLTGPMSIGGHEQQFENKQAQLRRLLRDFEALNCQGGIPEDSWGWATRDVPTRNLSPRVPTPEAAKNAGMAATGLVLARVLFLVGSALSEFL